MRRDPSFDPVAVTFDAGDPSGADFFSPDPRDPDLRHAPRAPAVREQLGTLTGRRLRDSFDARLRRASRCPSCSACAASSCARPISRRTTRGPRRARLPRRRRVPAVPGGAFVRRALAACRPPPPARASSSAARRSASRPPRPRRRLRPCSPPRLARARAAPRAARAAPRPMPVAPAPAPRGRGGAGQRPSMIWLGLALLLLAASGATIALVHRSRRRRRRAGAARGDHSRRSRLAARGRGAGLRRRAAVAAVLRARRARGRRRDRGRADRARAGARARGRRVGARGRPCRSRGARPARVGALRQRPARRRARSSSLGRAPQREPAPIPPVRPGPHGLFGAAAVARPAGPLAAYVTARATHLRFEHAAGADRRRRRRSSPPPDLAIVTLASGRGSATWLTGATDVALSADQVRAAIAEHRELTARCLAIALDALDAAPGFTDAAYLAARLAVKAGLLPAARALRRARPRIAGRPDADTFERDRRDLEDPAGAVAAAKLPPPRRATRPSALAPPARPA